MFFKIGVLKNLAISTGKHLCWSLFLIKLQPWRHGTLLKTDSKTSAFQWILRNLWEHLFHRGPSDGCLSPGSSLSNHSIPFKINHSNKMAHYWHQGILYLQIFSNNTALVNADARSTKSWNKETYLWNILRNPIYCRNLFVVFQLIQAINVYEHLFIHFRKLVHGIFECLFQATENIW